MKTILLLSLLLTVSAHAEMIVGIPDLPAPGVEWTELDVFYGGMVAGLVLGGTAFALRVVRQSAKQNPEV